MNTFLLPWESIAETKICTLSGEKFFVTDRDVLLYEQMSPVFSGKKYSIPAPTLAPITRMQRRMAFRNERYLYEKKSCLSDKNLITMYHPDDDRKVCEPKLWHGDSWSAFDYGRKIDFDRPMLPQIGELWHDVPMMALYSTGTNENCDYTNWFWGGKIASKNCYLCFNGWVSEDCMFCKGVVESKDCLEMYFWKKDYESYECVNCNECYAVFYSQDCTNCRECNFCSSCVGCQNCFGCMNLAGQQYSIFNEKLDKTTYENRIRELRLTHDNYPAILARVQKFHHSHPVRATHNVNCENSIGDYLVDCKNVLGFEVFGCENVKYVGSSKMAKDCMDMNWFGYYSDHMLESLGSGNSSQICFTACCEFCSEVYYSSWCIHSNHLFGCVGLKHAEYSLLNVAMGQQEYNELVPRVIDHMRSTGEWWEFFHPSISPFGYNETIGADDQPLDHATVQKYGWRWYDIPKKERTGAYVTPLDTAQYNPEKVDKDVAGKNIDTLLAGVIQCEKTGEPFRIIKEELRFYIKHDLPIPRKHPQARYNERITFMNRKQLRDAQCSECHIPIQTTYDSAVRKVVCEECYRKLVY